MMDPRYVLRDRFLDLRGHRGLEAELEGLWAVGNLEGLIKPCVAIVGTRSATPYGRLVAKQFARELGRAGCCIVSGLALGIDAAAHGGALEAASPTIGVLGGGHAHFFPKRNLELAQRMIAGGGAVLSPFAPDVDAHPWQFLARNRIVAALADAVVVIEAPQRSGALNTANWAAGRVAVFAVPGDIDRAHVAGCHALIRDGAILARSADDVLEGLGIQAPPPAPSRVESSDPLANAIVAVLARGDCDLDAIVNACPHRISDVLARLTQLELDGIIARSGTNRFTRTR